MCRLHAIVRRPIEPRTSKPYSYHTTQSANSEALPQLSDSRGSWRFTLLLVRRYTWRQWTITRTGLPRRVTVNEGSGVCGIQSTVRSEDGLRNDTTGFLVCGLDDAE